MKKIALYIMVIYTHLWVGCLVAQQEMILTKYTYNSLLFNPAYAGSHGYGQGTAILQYRNQWIGLEGAPTTYLIAGEASVAKDKVGVGLSIGRERIGIDSRTDIAASYAYRTELGKGSLSAGIRTSFSQYRSDFSGIVNVEMNDPVYINPDARFGFFAVGAGLYYNAENAYIGISIPAATVISGSQGSSFSTRHLYMHAGMMLGNDYGTIQTEPSFLLAYQHAAPLQITLGLNLWYKQQFAIGGHFRSQDAFALSSEMFLQQQYRIAIAYDFTISDIQRFSDGTFEVMMAYHFYKKPDIKRIKHLRHGGRF